MNQIEDSDSSSEEDVESIKHDQVQMQENEQNSWEEDSSSDSSDDNEQEEEVEVDDSDNGAAHVKKELSQSTERDNTGEGSANEANVQSSSSSSSSSDGSGSDSDSADDATNKTKISSKKEDRKVWEENPDIYGIRRSGRARKEPQRLVIQSGSDSDDNHRHKKKKRGRRKSESWMPTLSGSESEESDSSLEVPKRKQQKQNKQTFAVSRKQQRGHARSGSSDDFGKPHGGKKKAQYAGTRRAVDSKVSYKEDSEGATDSDDIIEQEEMPIDQPAEDVETIEKVMRHRWGRPGVTGAQTTIYAVEAEELAMLGEPDRSKEDTEVQFLIKWKDWSHLHNTWESKDCLINQRCSGMKKLENYIKRMEEIDKWKKISIPEDIEYFDYQQGMNEDIQKQYQQVERIIAHQFTADSSSYPDYFCKWQGLPYVECTWEDGALTARFFQKYIDEYLERERSDLIPNKNTKCLRHRPKFVPFKKQPEYVGTGDLQLRDYQLDGVNWLAHAWCREMSAILADEMGLGKTIQTISFLSYLFHTHSLYGPFLVVVPLSTLDAWQREFQNWGPDMNLIVYIGNVNSRRTIHDYEWIFKKSRKLKFNVVLTTYEMLVRDEKTFSNHYWACLLIDEAHRLKNSTSLLYETLFPFKTNYRLLITGTPLQNSLKELWCLMHFIMPDKFNSWEEFESQYSVSEKEGLQKLHRDLEPFLLRRVKKDVEKSLPAKVEQILRVEMSQVQKQYYKLILTKNVKELCKELKGTFSGLLNIIVELKKCCNHSSLIKPFDPTHEDPNMLQTLIKGSGKTILLDKLLSRLKETGHRVLIFSQMVRMLDIIAEYLFLKRFQFQRLDGSIRGEQRQRALDQFNAEGSQDFCFLLSTRAGGLGINLASADTVIIFDSDWNPQNDLQAMARAHRIGQKNQVNIYRFVTKSTIEEDIIERAKKKMVLDHLIIQRMDTTGRRVLSKSNTAPSSNAPFNKEELSSILKFGAEDLFKDHDQDADQKLHAMDIEEILQRAETQDTQEGLNSVGEELLSKFKVVNYAAFNEEEIKVEQPKTTALQKLWEEIIPEEDRKCAEEELEKEKKVEIILKPRSRKTVEKMNISQPTKKYKSNATVDTDSCTDSDSVEDDDEDAKVKKGAKKKFKAKAVTKEGVKGFTDTEIRRFIKSYKKFARPMTRLYSIAEDAELTDKSMDELKELGELLKLSCEQAIKEYQEKLVQDEQFDGKKKGASLKISGVTINAPSVLKAENDLEPLAVCLPTETTQQKSYRLTTPTRSVHWGITWGVIEDSMLLIGMLTYGVGNWDAIKNDESLGLTSKILPVGNAKPQNKHLQSRGDYLIRLLKEQTIQQSKPGPRKKRLKVDRKVVPQRHEGANQSESEQPKSTSHVEEEKRSKKKKTKKEKTEKREKKLKKKQERAVKESSNKLSIPAQSPLSSTLVLVEDFREGMDEAIFKKCKEKMRPEKKSLQLLHTPDEKAPQEDLVQIMKKCLLKIGDHIEKCLDEYNDQEHELNTWRSNLWSFVAKFTEFGPAKLHKIYRTAYRKRDMQRDEQKKEIQKLKTSHTNSLHELEKHVPSDRFELEEARKRALGINRNIPATKIPKLDQLKIPHKKKEKPPFNNNKSDDAGITTKEKSVRSEGERLRDWYRENSSFDSWSNRDNISNKGKRDNESRYHTPRDARHTSQKPWQKSAITDSDNREKSTGSVDRNTTSSAGKLQSYREWKEAQKHRNIPPDEKPNKQHRSHSQKPYRDKKIYGDEKQPYKQEQYSYDSRNRPRYYRDKPYEQKEHGDYQISPSSVKSPSASQSPHVYGDTWSRKRTSSNNSEQSDSHPSSKKFHGEPEQPFNSIQSWATGSNT